MNNRPKLDIPRTSLDNILEIAAILGVTNSFFLIWRYWTILPARIPTHFGFSGQPDGWGGKGMLILLPAISLILFIVLAVVGRFPRIYNYPFAITEANAGKQYVLARSLLGWLNFELVWFFAYMEWKTIQVAAGQARGLGPAAVFVFIFMTLGSLGIYIWLAYQAR